MEIYQPNSKNKQRVQVQVKDPDNKKSMSFTVHNIEVEDLFNKIVFLAERLSDNEDRIELVYYKGGIKPCQKDN